MNTKESLWDITESYLVAEHLELDDLAVMGKGNARTLKIIVDGEGLDLDRIAEVSRGLSRILDTHDDLSEPYQLEVTSPGLERALKRPAHFQKSVGREVALKVRDESGKVSTERGVIASADEDAVAIELDGEIRSYVYEDLISARTVFRWESSPKPGK